MDTSSLSVLKAYIKNLLTTHRLLPIYHPLMRLWAANSAFGCWDQGNTFVFLSEEE
jgi:hypothetical protein